MGGRGNPYRYKGRFASQDNFDTLIYTPFGVKGTDGAEFVSESEMRETQISWSEREAQRLNEEQARIDAKHNQDKLNRQQAAIRGKIKKLEKVLRDPKVTEYERQKASRQIVALRKKLS